MALRKSSRANLRLAVPLLVQTGLIVVLLLLIAAFRADLGATEPTIEPPLEPHIIHVEDIMVTQHPKPLPPPPRPPAPVEVVDNPTLQEDPIDLNSLTGFVNVLPDTPPLPPQAVTPSPEERPEDHVFIVVEEEPHLLPDHEAGMRALQRSITYPAAARRAEVEGTVSVQFVVDEHGTVRDAVVLKGIGAGCDEAALEAVRQARFKPGRQRGKAVKVQMTLPITFRLR